MVLPSQNNALFKKEGTSQTFGQLVLIPSLGDVAALLDRDYANSTIVPQDITVKLVFNDRTPFLGSDSLSDKDRSKIALAGFSENKDPVVAITAKADTGEVVLEGSSLNSFSRVKQNEIDHAIIVGSSYKPREEIKKVLQEAGKIDLMITLKSKDSEDINFNTLKEPELQASFTYNFFIPEEKDIISEEDPSKDPLLKNDIFNVPRYVELRWTPTKVTEQLTLQEKVGNQQEIQKMKREVFAKYRGSTSSEAAVFKDSFERSKKRTNLIAKEGRKMEVTDIHKLDTAFESISNSQVFTNSVNVVMNVQGQVSNVSDVPIVVQNTSIKRT